MKPSRRKVPGTYPTTPSPFDQTANYGRTKSTPYLNTSLGHQDINKDHGGYYNYLLNKAGVNTAEGAQPFHQWLKTAGMDRFETGYNNARLQNPKLSFAHYMQTTGVPGDANLFTAEATGAGAAAATRGRGKKRNKFNQYVNGAENSATDLANWMKDQRLAYRKLTPEQSGEFMPGYAMMGPSRWSVYG